MNEPSPARTTRGHALAKEPTVSRYLLSRARDAGVNHFDLTAIYLQPRGNGFTPSLVNKTRRAVSKRESSRSTGGNEGVERLSLQLLSLNGTQSIGDELQRGDRRLNRGVLILLETVANYGMYELCSGNVKCFAISLGP